MTDFDSIVVGAGHNGLVCAAYLARSGQRVLVLEACDKPGGLAASREFHPGFRASVAHSMGHFSARIVDDLELRAYGLADAAAMPTVGLSTDGDHVAVRDGALAGASEADADAYQAYRALMNRFADVLQPFWLKTMPRIGNNELGELLTFANIGLRLRAIGKKDMREFLRMVSLPVRDLMDEYFVGDLVKTVLGWDGLIGAKMAPRSPNSSVLAMLYRLSGKNRGAHAIPAGGVNALVDALYKSAEASGVEIRCATKVDRILVDANTAGLKARGVRLASGEEIDAARIISATDPQRTFLKLVGVENLDIGFTNRIRRLRCDGYVAKLHLALSDLPSFTGLDKVDERMIIAPDLDSIEFAFDDAKYGECSEHPVLEVVMPSLQDDAAAPAGQHVLSAHVMYVPNRLNGGWTDAARDRVCERALDTLARYAPGIREQVIGSEFLSPDDLERTHRLTGGHWHHTEFAMDQLLMMRPTYEAAQYRTPLHGLFLCGAGCHPGGDLTGAPGHNAAREILR